MHGIDIVIPDAYVYERLDWVRGIILSHGHEDHIGELAYLIGAGLHAPIMHSLTARSAEVKLREHSCSDDAELVTVTEDDVVDLDLHTVEFFYTCHSFDSVGISVQTPAGRDPHQRLPGFDPTPADDKPTEADKLRRLGRSGRPALACRQHERRTRRPNAQRTQRRNHAGTRFLQSRRAGVARHLSPT